MNCATGNLSETVTDVALRGRGVPLALTRTYNSQLAATAGSPGLFGFGWSSTFGDRLTEDGQGRLTIHQDNGSAVMFWPDGSGSFVAPPRVQATLAAAGGGHDFALPDGTGKHFDSSGRLTSVTSPSGQRTQLAYDASGRLQAINDPGGRSLTVATNGDGTVARVTTPQGRQVVYSYSAGELTSVTDLAGKSWTFAYDGRHRLVSKTDPLGDSTTNAYDTQDRVVEQSQPEARRWTWSYGASITRLTDPRGTTTELEFANNHLVRRTRAAGTPLESTSTFEYDQDGNPTVARLPGGVQTSSTWTSRGDLASSTDARGNRTSYEWDSGHRMTALTLPSGRRTELSYDPAGRLAEMRRHDAEANATRTQTFTWDGGLLASSTDPLSRTTRYDYDALGNLISVATPAGRVRTFAYDQDGYLTATVAPRGNVTGAMPSDYRTSYATDDLGRVTAKTDPLGHTDSATYDAAGNPTSITDASGVVTRIAYNAQDQPTIVTRADGLTTQTAYDAAGSVKARSDALGRTIRFEYDALGRVDRRTDALGRVTRFAYDAFDRLSELTDQAGQVATYGYDAGGNLTKVHYSTNAPGDVSFTYDVDDQRASMTDDSGTTRYDHDSLGRLVSVLDGDGRKVGYGYDAADQVTRIDYPATAAGPGGAVGRTFDADGLLASVRDFDARVTSFAYDLDGNLVRTMFPPSSGNVDEATYDADGQVTAMVAKQGEAKLASFAYVRDPVGRVTSSETSGMPAEGPHSYRYDVLGQLRAADLQSYEYTADGSITALDRASDGTYDDARQLSSLTVAGVPTTYSHDALGQRTASTPLVGAATTYGFDQARRLASVRSGIAVGGAETTRRYTYNGDGIRVSASSGGSTTQYTWDSQSDGLPLLLADGAAQYVYGPGGLPIEQIARDGTVSYLHHDQLGSTRLLTTSAGASAGTASYSPFGQPTLVTGAPSALGYAGQYTDPQTGLQYLRARDYDPVTAQFLSRDPIEDETGDPYAYAGNNPITNSDPSGLLFGVSFQDVADFAAGFGDSVTFGLTRQVRGLIGSDGTNYCSSSYSSGGIGGTAISMVLPAGAIARGTKIAAEGARSGAELLSGAARATHRGDLSVAGRALAKHGGRPGSSFPRPVGAAGDISAQAQSLVDDILAKQ